MSSRTYTPKNGQLANEEGSIYGFPAFFVYKIEPIEPHPEYRIAPRSDTARRSARARVQFVAQRGKQAP